MKIQVISNDIELDGEKVARILDIRPTLRERLILALHKAESYDSDVDNAYKRGKEDMGYEHEES